MAKSDIRQFGKEIFANLAANEKAVIHMEDLVKKVQRHVDLSDVPMEELERVFIERQIYPLATELEWASVVRGHGYFMNMKMCTNPDYFDKVIQNSNMDVQTKRQALAKKEAFKKIQCEIPGQLTLNLNTMEPEEEKTTEEILELLAKEA